MKRTSGKVISKERILSLCGTVIEFDTTNEGMSKKIEIYMDENDAKGVTLAGYIHLLLGWSPQIPPAFPASRIFIRWKKRPTCQLEDLTMTHSVFRVFMKLA
jgi:hypothetical protein